MALTRKVGFSSGLLALLPGLVMADNFDDLRLRWRQMITGGAALDMTVPQIRETVGADSLAYLSLPGLVSATSRDRSEFCTGCFTGRYPDGIHENLGDVVRAAEGVLADPALSG